MDLNKLNFAKKGKVWESHLESSVKIADFYFVMDKEFGSQ